MLPKFFSILIAVCLVKTVFQEEQCDAECYFKESYITSETIEKWPSTCEKVCGNLYFSSKTDLTDTKLVKYFNKLEYIIGDFKFEWTNLTSLKFLSSLKEFSCEKGAFAIGHNPLLTDIKPFKNWIPQKECVLHIANNSKLDFQPYCDKQKIDFNVDLNVYGNLKNCDCKNVRIGAKSLAFYPNCTTISGGNNGGLKFTRVNDDLDFSAFSLLKKVEGNIEIYETNLHNISFLGNLQTIIGQRLQAYNITNIHDNPNLMRLGLNSLKNLSPNDGGFTLNIEKNHPDFCLTTYELQVFAESMVVFYSLEATLCPDVTRKDGQKVCNYDKLSTLDADYCIHLIGDILINSDNENDVWKMKNVTNICGSLTVKDTENLEDFSFLEKLRQVATLKKDGPPIIRFLSNKQLRSVALPNMKTPPFSASHGNIIELDDNSQTIFANRKECLQYQQKTGATVKYNGDSCTKLPVSENPSAKPTEHTMTTKKQEMGYGWSETGSGSGSNEGPYTGITTTKPDKSSKTCRFFSSIFITVVLLFAVSS